MSSTRVEPTFGSEKFVEPNQALLFCDTTREWLHFSSPVEVISTDNLEEVVPLLQKIEYLVEEKNLYGAGWLSYEASPAFDSSYSVNTDFSGFPLLWFGIFAKPLVIQPKFPDNQYSYPWVPSIDEKSYLDGIETIKNLIASGDTYQVNFTYRLKCALDKNIVQLLSILNQPSPFYGGMIATENWLTASGSPELFFKLNDQLIISRPMKGTAPRGCTSEEDTLIAGQLQKCSKNRAENVMIVDMVRNDLTRIAHKGSVQVSDMFTIERYPTLFQMTSTVEAQTKASYSQIFKALFPPSSITGAPKTRTTNIIAELENTPRKIYTGTIGFMGPGRKAQFNVAIRTLLYDRNSENLEYGIGSGIVWDSDGAEELEECRTKSKICTPSLPEFSLFETILWNESEGFTLLKHHMSRMEGSAQYFSFPFNHENILQALRQLEDEFEPGKKYRVRVILDQSGDIRVEHLEFTRNPPGLLPKVTLAKKNVHTDNIFLYHKTTNRNVYSEAIKAKPGMDDVLLYNELGELTESTIANIVMKIDNTLYTPPIRCGLLAGTARAEMIQKAQVQEKVLPVSLLQKGYPLYLLNSIRGLYPVQYITNLEEKS